MTPAGPGRLARAFARLRAAASRPRWRLALGVALASDAVSFGLEFLSLGLAELPQLGVDLATAAALAVVLKWRWRLLPPLVVEAIPGLAVFPTWALAVAAFAAAESSGGEPPSPPPHP